MISRNTHKYAYVWEVCDSFSISEIEPILNSLSINIADPGSRHILNSVTRGECIDKPEDYIYQTTTAWPITKNIKFLLTAFCQLI